ncbi:MAG: ribonuclease H-like domain-containing protein [Crinalium sp.]
MNSATVTFIEKPYILVTEPSSLNDAIAPLFKSDIQGIDTETTGLDPHTHKLVLIQIATPNHPVVIINVTNLTQSELKPLSKLFTTNATKVFHNAKFDLKFLNQAGIDVSGPFFDTMLASKVLKAGLKKITVSKIWHYLCLKSNLIKASKGVTLVKLLSLQDSYSMPPLTQQYCSY